jgi:hypothetical protein
LFADVCISCCSFKSDITNIGFTRGFFKIDGRMLDNNFACTIMVFLYYYEERRKKVGSRQSRYKILNYQIEKQIYKMICSYISGRLGNQLFEYAYARALLCLRDKNERLMFNFNLVRSAGEQGVGFDDSLKDFCVLPYLETNKDIIFKYGSVLQCFVYTLFKIDQIFLKLLNKKRWFAAFRHLGILFQDYTDNSIAIRNSREKNIFCYGKYENPKYFNDIRPILLQEFTPKSAPLLANKKLYTIIESTNSVCISIRRGDFLSDKFRDRFLVCDKDYFIAAMAEMKRHVAQPTFVFFSDDIEWVKENIHPDVPCYYESGKDPVWEKLRLMYSCKHFIISNSTFSWWTQYLSRNENKVVISPDRWSNDPERNKQVRLISDYFIKIPTNHN